MAEYIERAALIKAFYKDAERCGDPEIPWTYPPLKQRSRTPQPQTSLLWCMGGGLNGGTKRNAPFVSLSIIPITMSGTFAPTAERI